jgi:hypothetical protein
MNTGAANNDMLRGKPQSSEGHVRITAHAMECDDGKTAENDLISHVEPGSGGRQLVLKRAIYNSKRL